MKYLITESQSNLISELERNWRDFEYKDQYNRVKNKMISFVIDGFDSYDEGDKRIIIYDSNGDRIVVFGKYNDGSKGELFYSRKLENILVEIFPHPWWHVHGKYVMSDAFESIFPKYIVTSVRSANIS